MRRGEWDVDRFFATIPAGKWEELKIAHAIIESRDEWVAAVGRGYKGSWQPPQFKPAAKPRRRRLNGQPL